MITGLPELNRYLDDAQWAVVSQAIRSAGGKVSDGNRLHVDAVLDLMNTRLPWRDLDYRYGPWTSVHAKFVRWFETGVLHGVVMALFKLGLTDTWRETYTEISHGPSARSGPQIRPLMATIANALRKHRDKPVKKGARKTPPKLPKAETNTYRESRKAYARRVKEAVKARKGLIDGRISDTDWELVVSRLPELDLGAQNLARRQVEELIDVMKTNKGWAYMDSKAGKWSATYARFMKWVSEGTMTRLVKCLHELDLTKDWNSFLVAPLAKGEKSLKMIIGAEAFANRIGKRTVEKKKNGVAKPAKPEAKHGKNATEKPAVGKKPSSTKTKAGKTSTAIRDGKTGTGKKKTVEAAKKNVKAAARTRIKAKATIGKGRKVSATAKSPKRQAARKSQAV